MAGTQTMYLLKLLLKVFLFSTFHSTDNSLRNGVASQLPADICDIQVLETTSATYVKTKLFWKIPKTGNCYELI